MNHSDSIKIVGRNHLLTKSLKKTPNPKPRLVWFNVWVPITHNCWHCVWIAKTWGKLAQNYYLFKRYYWKNAFQSGTRYGQHELLLGAANGSKPHNPPYLIQCTGKPRSGFVGWQLLLRKRFLPAVAIAGPSPPISFLSHRSKYVFSGTFLPSFSPISIPSPFCALSVNRAA